MVQKSHADEKIGTFSTDKKGGLVVVEYSQLTNEQRYLRDDADQLVHRLGSTGVNVASVKGLREVACTYPFIVHAARKRVWNVLDESGKSSETWWIKYETFLHECYRGFTSADWHPYFVMDAKRDGSFAPVKNLHWVDSPETARRDLMRLHASWLKFSGIEIPRYSDGFPLHGVEVDPMCAVDHMTAREVFQLASCSRRREGMRWYFFTNSQST